MIVHLYSYYEGQINDLPAWFKHDSIVEMTVEELKDKIYELIDNQINIQIIDLSIKLLPKRLEGVELGIYIDVTALFQGKGSAY